MAASRCILEGKDAQLTAANQPTSLLSYFCRQSLTKKFFIVANANVVKISFALFWMALALAKTMGHVRGAVA